MEKFFNIAGPCIPAEHYMLPALDRLPEIQRLVARRQCFVIHAPRQTGKTTAIQALVREINAKGDMVALYCTLETLQNATDPDKTNRAIQNLLFDNYCAAFPDNCDPVGQQNNVSESKGIEFAVRTALRELCRRAGKPLVVFFDEADCLFGNVLISFLRQLRDGYVNRADIPFPASIALVGMLDVRDYKAQMRPDVESLGQISPFNIISEDMMLRNFTAEEVASLYAQHTAATGQQFASDVLDAVVDWTGGQPWLVNAIARECVEKIHAFRYGDTITAADIETAKETIIRENPIHLDYLFYIANHPSVRPFMDAALDGSITEEQRNERNFRLLLHLGILSDDGCRLEFTNLLYKEYWGRRTAA